MQELRSFAAIILAGLAVYASAADLTLGDKAPPIKVAKWVQGSPVSNGPGTLRVVEFWATWCGPCKQSIPHLTELSKKFKGKVTFTGVDVFERSPDDVTTVQKFLKTMGAKMAYNVAVDEKTGTMAKNWMIAAHQPGIPTAFIVDKTGTVVWIGHPMVGLEEALDQLIAGTYDLKKAKAEFGRASVAQAVDQSKQQAAAQAVAMAVSTAKAEYKAGRKAEAMATLDKLSLDHPERRIQSSIAKVQLLLSDSSTVEASAVVEKEAALAGAQSSYAYLQFGMVASMAPTKNEQSKSFALALAEKALAASATDPIVGYEAAMIYANNGQIAKATALDQDALKNVVNAKPEIQSRLKQAIQEKLTEFQSKKS